MPFEQGLDKLLLCTLNAKFIHSSLALRYLQSYCKGQTGFDIEIREFTINQNTSDIMADIYLKRPDVLAFSCYIWNIEPILQLCADYKQIAPETVIVLGGPEVSYTAPQILSAYSCVDYVIRGEGEETFKDLLASVKGDLPLSKVAGITYRQEGRIVDQAERAPLNNLDDIPFPYQGERGMLTDRIIYYESSRGCPFHCSYCLSGNSNGVRYFSLDRVKNDLAVLLGYNVKEIKFVDRTFNCNEQRAMEIMKFIADHRGTAKIHLEIDAGLFSDEMLEFLGTVPGGLFNFEIGIQSTYEPALRAVRRKQNWDRLSHNIRKIQSYGTIHLHLDLIAGLPGEDWEKLARSFNMVYSLNPDVLQLGFLKLLPGSDLIKECRTYDYIYQSRAPYQVLSNRDLSYRQIIALQQIEEILNQYYNSGDMPQTLKYIGQRIFGHEYFSFYHEFSLYWQVHGWFGLGHKKENLYSILQTFIRNKYPLCRETVNELLKYDFLTRNHKYVLPEGLLSNNPGNINDIIYSYLKNKEFTEEYLPGMAAKTSREIRKLVHLEYFHTDPLTFENHEQAVMFVYNPVSKTADKIINLSNTAYAHL